MIPLFPEFKSLEIEDRVEIQALSEGLPAYSDFDFVSLWSWDISGNVRVSTLNGNLVVRFTDYLSQEPFLSFIGLNKINKTALEIFQYCKQNNLTCQMKLVPQEVADSLDRSLFAIQEDRNNFDYIYRTEDWKNFSGGDYARKRNEVNSLLSTHPQIECVELDMQAPLVVSQMNKLYETWIENKLQKGEDYEKNELVSFQRLLLLADCCEFVSSGLLLDGQLVAFCISEATATNYAVGHAAKADSRIKGTNALLMKNLGEILQGRGKSYFNYEQDLGIESLRQAKERFRPSYFLKKYIVTQLEISTPSI